MEFVAIIPARYASTRFPGKPLAMLGGKPVIRRVYEQVTGVLPDAVVATDDERILRAVEEFGGRAVMTSSEHRSGTDRCWEAYGKLGREYDAVINVQGDEPFIRPEQLRAIMRCFDVPGTDIGASLRRVRRTGGARKSQFAESGARRRVAGDLLFALGDSLPAGCGAVGVAGETYFL